MGVGIPGGCEAAVHSARRFLETLPLDNVLVKLDFSNAFSSLHRFDMLQCVTDRIPQLFAYSHAAYSNAPFCTMVSTILCPRRGLSRETPGPTAFLQHHSPVACITKLSPQAPVYMDNITLGDQQETINESWSRYGSQSQYF